MALSKKTFPKTAAAAPTGLDPFQNFETVTYTGNGSTQKITGYIRKGAAFNGSSSYIATSYTLPSDSTMSFSFWVNVAAFGAGDTYIMSDMDSSTNDRRLDFRFNSSGYFMVDVGNGSSNDTGNTDSVTQPTNTWIHFAVVLNGTSLKVYKNGNSTPIVDTTLTVAFGTAGGRSLTLGRAGDYTGSAHLNGKLDQFRIFNTELDSTKVGQLAAEDYSKATKSTTDIFGNGTGVALYELDEDALSSNFKQAASFNGSSSKIILPNSLSTAVGNNDFSVSFFVYVNDVSNDEVYVNLSNPYQFYVRKFASGNIYIELGGVNGFDTGVSLSTGWHHIAVTKSSTAGLVLYVDNTPNTFSSKTANLGSASVDTSLGGYNNGTLPLDGKLDQVRIFDTALSSSDVTKLYNEAANIPTTNLVAHYKLDGNAEDVLDTYDGTASNVTYTNGVYGGTPTNVNFLGMAFQPDFVWVKQRNEALNHVLFDSVRGAGNRIVSNITIAEDTGGGYGVVNSFDSNGFTVDIQTQTSSNNVNKSGGSYVAWCWKAGGAAVSGTGTSGITNVEVSANTEAGFSIVKYDGGGTAGGTVTHGLDSAPELIIIKRTDDSGDWIVGSDYLTSWGHILQLNLSDAEAGYAGFNSTAPTTSVFTLGSNNPVNNASGSYVAYCFHSVDGYQRIGTYTGASGRRVYTTDDGTSTGSGGFQPRFLMVKKTATANWVIIDSVRVNGIYEDILFPNTDAFEAAGDYDELTFNSDGFTWNQTENTKNAVGGEYIYLAIA